MPYVTKRRIHTSAFTLPSVPRIDYGNEFARDLKGVFTLVGGVFCDVYNGNLPNNNTAGLRGGIRGLNASYSNQTTDFTNDGTYSLASALSIAMFVDIDSLANYNALVSCQDTSTTNGYEFRCGGAGSTDSYMMFHRANTGYRQWRTSSNQLSSGSTNNYVGLSCADADVNTAPSVLNVNGTSASMSTSASSGTGDQVASTDDFHIGRRNDGGTRLNGAVHLVVLWARELSFADHERFRLNPYQIFEPELTRIYIAGGAGPTIASPTGVSATGTIGALTVTGAANVSPTGVSSTGTVGSITVNYGTSFAITGVSSTGTIGALTVDVGSTIVSITGVSSTGTPGTLTATGAAIVAPSGVSSTGTIGSVTASFPASFAITGVSSTGTIGTITVDAGGTTVSITGVISTGTVGSLAVVNAATVSITGVSATGKAGTLTFYEVAATIIRKDRIIIMGAENKTIVLN